jgi:hypothetical protein
MQECQPASIKRNLKGKPRKQRTESWQLSYLKESLKVYEGLCTSTGVLEAAPGTRERGDVGHGIRWEIRSEERQRPQCGVAEIGAEFLCKKSERPWRGRLLRWKPMFAVRGNAGDLVAGSFNARRSAMIG